MLIGTWALVVVFVMSSFGAAVMDLIGTEPTAMRHWIIVFASTFVLFLPATAAMGATLPALERATSMHFARVARWRHPMPGTRSGPSSGC